MEERADRSGKRRHYTVKLRMTAQKAQYLLTIAGKKSGAVPGPELTRQVTFSGGGPAQQQDRGVYRRGLAGRLRLPAAWSSPVSLRCGVTAGLSELAYKAFFINE
ncbi:hypothetical protein Arth_1774 [Arthrobacter sp. FB24]|nr:hypothetical protein Arth_1774 [Arthrobacter sp. FB24]